MGVPVYSYLRFPCVNCSFPIFSTSVYSTDASVRRWFSPWVLQVFSVDSPNFLLGFCNILYNWVSPIFYVGFPKNPIRGIPRYWTRLSPLCVCLITPWVGFPPYYSNQPLEVLRESQYDILSVNIHHHFVADIFSSFCSGEIVIDIRRALIYRYIYSSSLSSVI